MTYVQVAFLLETSCQRVLLIGELVRSMCEFFQYLNWLNNIEFDLNRCGALSLGDQILSIDDSIIENSSYTPDEVMSFLNGPSDRGFTQIQILPVHAINRKG